MQERKAISMGAQGRIGWRKPIHRPFSRHGGFTLLELLVVMVIIGLLAAYVGPRYFAQIGKSEEKVARAQIVAFEKALDQYRIDTGHYPTSEQGLAALTTRPQSEASWAGPYLSKGVPPDPWGVPYQYKAPGEHGELDIFCTQAGGGLRLGTDGKPISNW